MTKAEIIRHGYAELCTAEPAKSFEAYAGFYYDLNDLGSELTVAELAPLGPVDRDDLDIRIFYAAAQARNGTFDEGKAYFSGPGAIVVGSDDGRFRAVDFELGEVDPDSPGSGQVIKQAVCRMGLGLVAAKSALFSHDLGQQQLYDVVEEALRGVGIDEQPAGFANSQRASAKLLSVGANGMIPTPDGQSVNPRPDEVAALTVVRQLSHAPRWNMKTELSL